VTPEGIRFGSVQEFGGLIKRGHQRIDLAT
jgi:hypothetical protein